jgi:hypothetical protein
MKAQARHKFTHVPTRLGLTLALVVVGLGVMVTTVAWARPGNPDPDPDPGTHSAPAATTVSITYDEPISAATVTSRTFAVHGMQTGLVTGVHSAQNSTILVAPINPFHPGELVQATATTHTTSIAGEYPLAPTVWQFRVAVDGGSGRFSYGSDFGPGDDWTKEMAVGDVDGDGNLDLAVGNYDQQNAVYLNNGDSIFDTISHTFGTGSDNTYALAMGDMDGDGDLDLAVGNYDQQNAVYLNNGDSTFGNTPYPFGPSDSETHALAMGDVDGDGDLDLAVGNAGLGNGQNMVYLNHGDATFPTLPHAFGTGSDNTITMALGDVDGDGDLDLAVGNAYQQNAVYLNDGDGTFPISHTFGTDLSDTPAVALGDVNGDGSLDLAVGNWGEQNVVHINDGVGNPFDTISHTFGTGADRTGNLALGDVDGDGNLDLIVGNSNQQNVVYLNDGDGTFDSISRTFSPNTDSPSALVMGDVDGDGDLDLAVGNQGEKNVIYLNQVDVYLPLVLRN